MKNFFRTRQTFSIRVTVDTCFVFCGNGKIVESNIAAEFFVRGMRQVALGQSKKNGLEGVQVFYGIDE
jgi:hypothetical protein